MEELRQLVRIQEMLKQGQYRLTSHAEQERESDSITIDEIEDACLSHQAEVIENYPQDLRGRSCLLLGFSKRGEPIHVVCGVGEEMLIIITVYRPHSEQWINWKTRRKTRL